MSEILFQNETHFCVVFRNLVGGRAVQANQFLIIDGAHSALLDPGGDLTYNQLYLALGKYTSVKSLDYVIASHQDPDIVASINRWLTGTECKVIVPAIWERFIPHFIRSGKDSAERILTIPDEGMRLKIGDGELYALAAHFLHSEGNFQFYDPQSGILFSGDLGANLCPAADLNKPVTRLTQVLPYMTAFHQRYMNGNRVCRLWANMVRGLDIAKIVPQHGRGFEGRAIIELIDWIENLQCGTDLMTQDHYRIPEAA